MNHTALKNIIPFCQTHLQFDTDKLKRDLSICLQNDWRNHFNQQDYSGEWKVISLRSVSGKSDDLGAYAPEKQFINTPLLRECHYFQEVLGRLECEKESIRLLNLRAGSKILPHTDSELSYASGTFRMHISIETNPEIEFIINGEKVEMLAGELWYGNFELPHSVTNHGKTDRIHLIIDCKRNDWTDELFTNSGINIEQLLLMPRRMISKQEILDRIKNLELLGGETAELLIKLAQDELNTLEDEK